MKGTIRVIVVDDIAETRASIIRLLNFDEGITVVGQAADGYAALKLCRQITPDCVLMDVNMPGLDGIATTKVLTREMPHIAVVMMSVQDDQAYRRSSERAGAKNYLLKPFGADELVAALHQACEAEVRV